MGLKIIEVSSISRGNHWTREEEPHLIMEMIKSVALSGVKPEMLSIRKCSLTARTSSQAHIPAYHEFRARHGSLSVPLR